MQESFVFLLRVQCRRKESSRSLSHLLMSFLLYVTDVSGKYKKRTINLLPSHRHQVKLMIQPSVYYAVRYLLSHSFYIVPAVSVFFVLYAKL